MEQSVINMNSISGIVVASMVLYILFLLLGNRFFRLLQRAENLAFEWLMGFSLFLGIFSIVDLPIELARMPFHVLVYAEIAVFVVLIVLCVGWYVRENIGQMGIHWKYFDKLTAIFLILITVQVLYGMNNRIYASYTDTCYYNGHAINAIYTDTMYQYDAYTGVYFGDAVEWNDSYPMLIAVLAKCFAVHPLVAINRIVGILEIVAVNLIIYEIALVLSDGKRRIAVWTVGIHAGMSLLCWNLTDLNEYFLWVRMAESKSMLANVYLPLVLFCMILIAKQTDKKSNWGILAVNLFAGVAMSMSGIFIITIMVGAGLLPILFYRSRVKYWNYAILCMLPALLMGAARLLG